jgi:hypothetical protein
MSAPAINVPGLPDLITKPAKSSRFSNCSKILASSSNTDNDKIFAPLPGKSNVTRAVSGSGNESVSAAVMQITTKLDEKRLPSC